MRRHPAKSKQESVYEHISATSHLGSLEDFEIIGRESSRNDFLLRVKESLFIKRHKQKLNENLLHLHLHVDYILLP